MSYIFLSFPITTSTPGFGGHLHFNTEMKKSLACGDSCNQQLWHIDNHTGTHLDAPLHFHLNSKSVDAYSAEEWIFRSVGFCSIDASLNQIITAADLDLKSIGDDIELLLIRTGFGERRESEDYWRQNPGLAPELADALRGRFPKLRAVGFDFISLTSYQNREVGRAAHKAFLEPARAILVVEDMNLSELRTAPAEVIVSPLRVKDSDGAPCTIFARL